MIEPIVLQSRGKDLLCLIEYSTPENRGKKTIVFRHGLCGQKSTPHRMLVHLSHRLTAQGYTVVRFDCPGSGDSEGDWHDMSIPAEAGDLKLVLHWVQEHLAPQKLMLMGYSMGGAVVSLCSQEIPVDGILLWSPVSRPARCLRHILGDERYAAACSGSDVDWNGDRIGAQFFQSLEDIDVLSVIRQFRGPVRILIGAADTVVPPETTQDYLDVISDCRRVLIPDAGHEYDAPAYQDALWAFSEEFVREIMP